MDESGYPLGSWIGTKRQEKRRGTLNASAISQLEGLGMVWSPYDHLFNQNLETLARFVRREGHARATEAH